MAFFIHTPFDRPFTGILGIQAVTFRGRLTMSVNLANNTTIETRERVIDEMKKILFQ